MKTFSKILVFCALSALFSACPRKKPQETKVAVNVSGTEMTNFDSVIQKDMPLAGTNITLLSTSGADAQTLLYGANQPDVFEVSYADRQTLIPFSAPLDQFFASEYDRTTFTLGYYTPGTFGPHYFVPFRLHWLAFLYNREKVPNSPTTPEELADICATHPGGLGIAADDDQALVEFVVTMIWAFGGNELELQDPNTMRTFYFLNNLGACVIKYSENYNNQSLADALAKGEIDFAFADLETTRKLWENGSYPYPIAGAKFPSAKPIVFTGSYLGVNKNSKDPLKAFQAAFYIASPGSCARSIERRAVAVRHA